MAGGCRFRLAARGDPTDCRLVAGAAKEGTSLEEMRVEDDENTRERVGSQEKWTLRFSLFF